jgi:ferredoxin-NADP reductase
MTIHGYQPQRDLADSMPLVTESGRGTAVEQLDRDRRAEIRERSGQLADELDLPETAAFGRHLAQFLRQRPAIDVDARIDATAFEVYACGLNGMGFGVETAMNRLGIPDRHIHGEGYG